MAGTITALEPQKKNAERVNVYLDGAFAFGVSAVDAARLRVGKALSDPEIAALRDQDEASRAFERAVRLLGSRARSVSEIRQALVRHKTAPDVIEKTLARLVEHGYVDDQSFAQAWIASRQTSHPLSARALRYELRGKGVADSTIDEALAGLDQGEAAYKALCTQVKRLNGLDKRETYTRLGAFLARRGFDYGTARAAIDRLWQELLEQDERRAATEGDDDLNFD